MDALPPKAEIVQTGPSIFDKLDELCPWPTKTLPPEGPLRELGDCPCHPWRQDHHRVPLNWQELQDRWFAKARELGVDPDLALRLQLEREREYHSRQREVIALREVARKQLELEEDDQRREGKQRARDALIERIKARGWAVPPSLLEPVP
jgi:hypothetical protein